MTTCEYCEQRVTLSKAVAEVDYSNVCKYCFKRFKYAILLDEIATKLVTGSELVLDVKFTTVLPYGPPVFDATLVLSAEGLYLSPETVPGFVEPRNRAIGWAECQSFGEKSFIKFDSAKATRNFAISLGKSPDETSFFELDIREKPLRADFIEEILHHARESETSNGFCLTFKDEFGSSVDLWLSSYVCSALEIPAQISKKSRLTHLSAIELKQLFNHFAGIATIPKSASVAEMARQLSLQSAEKLKNPTSTYINLPDALVNEMLVFKTTKQEEFERQAAKRRRSP